MIIIIRLVSIFLIRRAALLGPFKRSEKVSVEIGGHRWCFPSFGVCRSKLQGQRRKCTDSWPGCSFPSCRAGTSCSPPGKGRPCTPCPPLSPFSQRQEHRCSTTRTGRSTNGSSSWCIYRQLYAILHRGLSYLLYLPAVRLGGSIRSYSLLWSLLYRQIRWRFWVIYHLVYRRINSERSYLATRAKVGSVLLVAVHFLRVCPACIHASGTRRRLAVCNSTRRFCNVVDARISSDNMHLVGKFQRTMMSYGIHLWRICETVSWNTIPAVDVSDGSFEW